VEILQNWLETAQMPFLTAFILGLMTAVSPCPLSTNITAMAFIGKDLTDRRSVFIGGLVYTAGRAITYSGLGLLFYFGASQFQIAGFVQKWGEKLLGPLLILIGILMLDMIRIHFPGIGKLSEKIEQKSTRSYSDVLILGIVFALAFCPYSGVLYFGMLIPMTIASASGLYLPFIFALGTGIPVVIFAYFIAFALGRVGEFFNKLKTFEIIFRRTVAVLFILVGIYYSSIFFLNLQ
jgi:cytochrome c biogenesis protein CcdA